MIEETKTYLVKDSLGEKEKREATNQMVARFYHPVYVKVMADGD